MNIKEGGVTVKYENTSRDSISELPSRTVGNSPVQNYKIHQNIKHHTAKRKRETFCCSRVRILGIDTYCVDFV